MVLKALTVITLLSLVSAQYQPTWQSLIMIWYDHGMMRPSLVFSCIGGCTLCQVLDLSGFGTAGKLGSLLLWSSWKRTIHPTSSMLILLQCSRLNFLILIFGQSCWACLEQGNVYKMIRVINRHCSRPLVENWTVASLLPGCPVLVCNWCHLIPS